MSRLEKPTTSQVVQINGRRQAVAENLARRGTAGALILGIPGPCSADGNRISDGTLAGVHHGRQLAKVGEAAGHTLMVLRWDGEKPRTSNGMTGLIHKPGGAQTYTEAALSFHEAGIPLAAEIVSDAGTAIMGPHLTVARIGAREVSATGPRYAVRPTEQDRDNGLHPMVVLVKSGQNGSLKHTINALRTIMSEKPEARTRFGADGMEEVVTLGNPHVGVTLRGNDTRPDGNILDAVEAEIYEARDELDREFGIGSVALLVDTSHGYAKYGHKDGGEEGQLAVAEVYKELIMTGAPIDGWTGETYILPGKQPDSGTVPGLSLTDKCVRQELAETLVVDMDAAWEIRTLEAMVTV